MTDRATIDNLLAETAILAPSKVPGLDALIGLDLGGEGGGQWSLTFAGGNLSVADGLDPAAGATLKLTAADFEALCRGKLNPVAAYMSGRLKVTGNLAVVMRLQPLFQ